MDKNDELMIIPNLINSMNREDEILQEMAKSGDEFFQEMENTEDRIFREITLRAKNLAKKTIDELEDETFSLEDEREQLIKAERSKWNQQYKQLINSGLKITARDKNYVNIYKIMCWMNDNGSWKIPFPDGCQPTDQNIEPKEWIIQALTPIYEANHVIYVCNYMLNDEIDVPTYQSILEGIKNTPLSQTEGEKGLHTEYTPPQLDFIFDEMVKIENLEKTQRLIFINTFQGKLKSGSKSLKWIGDKSLIRYFFEQMTGRDDIKPSEINTYITDTIDSHDTIKRKGEYQGASHRFISSILKNAKEVK